MRYQTVFALCFITSVATQAQSASLKTFEAGERVKAAEVNGNFEYLEQKINPLVNDSAPTIEVLNFGYDSSIARYTGDLIISDDSELFWIKVQVGYLAVPTDFVNALGPLDMQSNYGNFLFPTTDDSSDDSEAHDEEHGDEHDASTSNRYLDITDFWPAPSTSEARILGAVFRADTVTGEGPVQIVAQDTSGKLNRLVIQVPAWPGGLFSSGVYVLDSPISLDLAAVETACGVNARNRTFGPDGDIVSLILTEFFPDSVGFRYELTSSSYSFAAAANADSDESEIQFDLGSRAGYSSDVGSWYSKPTLTMTFVSDSVVSFDAYYECGTIDGGNEVPGFTYSSGAIMAVLTVED